MFGPKLGKRFLNVIALIEKKPKEKHIRANFVIKGEPRKEVPKEDSDSDELAQPITETILDA